MNTKENLKTVMQKAWWFVKNEGMTLSNALRTAWRYLKLRVKMLVQEAVKFAFRKADGTIREAVGTRLTNHYQFKGTGYTAPQGVTRFWDLEKMQVRSFRDANLVAVM